MKIGILTLFHKSTNYGGVLQAYALCKFLNDQGHAAEQILYCQKSTKINKTKITAKKIAEKVFAGIKRRLYRNKNQEIRKRLETLFVDFRDSVPHSDRVYTKETIGESVSKYEVFVTGSDQVWNPNWHDTSYMLDFVGQGTPKVSYAASFGVERFESIFENILQKNLRDFRGISVREKTAQELLSKVLEQEVEVCVDPTLLLSAKDWDEVASDRLMKDKYVFVYFLGNDKKMRRLAEQFAKEKGLRLVMIPDLIGSYTKEDHKMKATFLTQATPNDFVSLVKHAEYVLTDSFHACVFSLLYQKEFFVFERVGVQKMSSRIRGLTEMFSCCQRFCSDEEKQTLDYLLNCAPLDAERKTFFEETKQKSIDFLNTIL